VVELVDDTEDDGAVEEDEAELVTVSAVELPSSSEPQAARASTEADTTATAAFL
jgi:hypothetical protein